MIRRELSWVPNCFSRICSRHFIGGVGPTQENPVPTLFEYNNWGEKQNSSRSTNVLAKRNSNSLDVGVSPTYVKREPVDEPEVVPLETELEKEEQYCFVVGEVEIGSCSGATFDNRLTVQECTPVVQDHQYVLQPITDTDVNVHDVECQAMVNQRHACVQTDLTLADIEEAELLKSSLMTKTHLDENLSWTKY
ncbi:uncharacterized protein [Ptychodera flava]|uniref:uncharacterized protein n=1 Tax=Ptychodera flava TaxID=63121 RepID=UPI00396A538E